MRVRRKVSNMETGEPDLTSSTAASDGEPLKKEPFSLEASCLCCVLLFPLTLTWVRNRTVSRAQIDPLFKADDWRPWWLTRDAAEEILPDVHLLRLRTGVCTM